MGFCYYAWITCLWCAGSLDAWLEALLGGSREGFSVDPFSPATKCQIGAQSTTSSALRLSSAAPSPANPRRRPPRTSSVAGALLAVKS